MKTIARHIGAVLLLFAALSCGRKEPAALVTDPPGGVTKLSSVAVYFLGSRVAEPSGIVYNPKTNTFLVVSDSHPEVYEIDFKGTVLRTITTTSTDLEGIALSQNSDTLFIAEEKNRFIVSYRLDGTRLSAFSADVATLVNNALEGVTVSKNGHLFVLNEKNPGMLLEYTPAGTEIRRMPLSFALDFSDLYYDRAGDCLWILSDESQKVMKVSLSGTLLAEWSLPFSKGEGISIVRDTMYIVNDADAKMYVFRVPQ